MLFSRLTTTLLLLSFHLSSTLHTAEPELGYFNIPPTWHLIDPAKFPEKVTMMVATKGKREISPTINLVVEPTKLPLKSYLKIATESFDAQGVEWKLLGELPTQRGTATLAQYDIPCQWGTLRYLQTVYIENEKAYILTASALREEFSEHYEPFFEALRSFNLTKKDL